MKVWIDIENPPQVQYLLPLRKAFAGAGAETVVTARNYGSTVAMLDQAGVEAHVRGHRAPRAKLHKLGSLAQRGHQLARFFSRTGRPDVLVAASRPGALAAWRMGIPSLIIGDYEYANLSLYGLTRSTLLYPDVIDRAAFLRRGVHARQLVPFKGIKEDLTFAGLDVEAIEPYDLGAVPDEAVRVLFRPPSETSHYYNAASTTMGRAALAHLGEAGSLVVFSPREPEQVAYLDGIRFKYPPVVLERPIPFIALLRSVDAVVCSGGTMLREAAFLGIPAFSIFQSEIGAVDRWLERIGRVALLSGRQDLPRIQLRRRGALDRLDSNPHLVEEIVALTQSKLGVNLGPGGAQAA